MNLPKDFNTIMALVLILVIIILYYGYYFLKDMMQNEIKDFYIKAEKSRIKKDRKDREINLERENTQLKNKLIDDNNNKNYKETQDLDIFQLEDINNFNDIEIDNVDVNKLEIESFVDPVRNTKDNDHAAQNKTLANRTFEL